MALLLEQIDLTDTIITIDAMGYQKNIVAQIVDGGGDALIAVKDNQPTLKAAIENHFKEHLQRDLEDLRYRFHETRDEGHGRKDERSYYLTKPPSDFGPKNVEPRVDCSANVNILAQPRAGRFRRAIIGWLVAIPLVRLGGVLIDRAFVWLDQGEIGFRTPAHPRPPAGSVPQPLRIGAAQAEPLQCR